MKALLAVLAWLRRIILSKPVSRKESRWRILIEREFKQGSDDYGHDQAGDDTGPNLPADRRTRTIP